MSLNRVLRDPAAGKSGLSFSPCRPTGGACLFFGVSAGAIPKE